MRRSPMMCCVAALAVMALLVHVGHAVVAWMRPHQDDSRFAPSARYQLAGDQVGHVEVGVGR